MKPEDFEKGKTYNVTLLDETTVDVYKLDRGVLCNAHDCTTEYEYSFVEKINR